VVKVAVCSRGPRRGLKARRQRRRDRDAETWRRAGWEMGRGYPHPHPTRGSGGASWGPPAGSGAEPRPKM